MTKRLANAAEHPTREPIPNGEKANHHMAKKAAKLGKAKKATGDLIISKSRTKACAKINVSGDFYSALDEAVRGMIACAEKRAMSNGRKTLRPQDL